MKEIKIPHLYVSNAVSQYPSLSVDNEYIPIHSLTEGELLKKGENKILLYNLIFPSSGDSRQTGRSSTFCKQLDLYGNWVKLKLPDIDKEYFSNNGTVLCIDAENFKLTPLMLIAVKQKYLFDIKIEETDINKFCLIINNDFINDEHNFKIYRNVKKAYIDKHSKDIDVLYTNNIFSLCYNNSSLTVPKFGTIPEMLDYNNSINEIVNQSFHATTI